MDVTLAGLLLEHRQTFLFSKIHNDYNFFITKNIFKMAMNKI